MDKQITDNFLFENLVIQLNNKQLRVNIYDTPLGLRWIEALKDNLKQKRILEKNFCFLGWADSKRNLTYLCKELNKNIAQINSFNFNPPYKKIKSFSKNLLPRGVNLEANHLLNGIKAALVIAPSLI